MKALKMILVAVAVFVLPYNLSANGPKYTGTYTSLSYHQESGDLLGAEIRIVWTQKGYQGTLQISEGTPGPLIVITPHITNKEITFEIADPHPDASRFTGKFDGQKLKGVLHYKTGGKMELELIRGKSYWD